MSAQRIVSVTTQRLPELMRYTFEINRNRVTTVEYKQDDCESVIWSRESHTPGALKKIFNDVEGFILNQERRDDLEKVVKATKPVRIRN
ncbi:TPA: hypothetical protein ACGSTL_001272 [Vibrio parahaemolyticus]|uniref:hypothetical protein n=1 Tax=Vibrio campbellii TaxID=680 RepID=UPI001F0738C6|nr:hypothetical protein [Vibrio campbellii]UMM06690.1 hypothetical protein MKR81_27465 [Vibrio campbellii]